MFRFRRVPVRLARAANATPPVTSGAAQRRRASSVMQAQRRAGEEMIRGSRDALMLRMRVEIDHQYE